MGFKFDDILIKGHDHKKLLNFFKSKEFENLSNHPSGIDWEIETRKPKYIERIEEGVWQSLQGYTNKIQLEYDSKTPWMRIDIYSVGEMSDKIMDYIVENFSFEYAGEFNHMSISEYCSIDINKQGDCFRNVSYSYEENQMEWTKYISDEKVKKEIIKIPESIWPLDVVKYFWEKYFEEIPFLYFRDEAPTEIKILDQLD